jgi:PhnB protein
MVGQRAVPMISYEDVATAVEWLSRAFGFRERGERFTDDDGRVTHAELELDGATVMIGWPGSDYHSPGTPRCRLRGRREMALRALGRGRCLGHGGRPRRHHARAATAGAEIIRGPERIPIGRLYTASDHEGHRWMFLQPALDERPADGVIQR